MKKLIFLLFFISSYIHAVSQTSIEKSHAFKMLVIHNTDGSTKGWFPCDYIVEFSYVKKELRSVFLTANNKDLKIDVKGKDPKDKYNYSTYELNGFTYRMYSGFDNLTGEDVKVLVGYETKNEQLKPISMTLLYDLSSNYISFNS